LGIKLHRIFGIIVIIWYIITNKNLNKRNMERNVKQTFVSANLLEVEVIHNGYKGGDAGHGGFVTIKLSDAGSTAMDTVVLFNNMTKVNQLHHSSETGEGFSIEQPDSVTLTFKGDTERDTLIESLEFILKELKENR
jgi:hypothetical protein